MVCGEEVDGVSVEKRKALELIRRSFSSADLLRAHGITSSESYSALPVVTFSCELAIPKHVRRSW